MSPTKTLAALAAAATVCACAATDPVVDRMGVNDAKYERDLAACKQSSGTSLLSLSNPVASCMTGKGYRVLMGKSLI